MLGFEEQLKALLQQLRVFDVRELDIPPDLEHSPRINTVVWRLTGRALYSLNAEIHTASMKVPLSLSLLSPLLTLLLHSSVAVFPSFLFLSLTPAAFVTLCGAAALCLSLHPSLHLSVRPSVVLSLSVPFHWRGSV